MISLKIFKKAVLASAFAFLVLAAQDALALTKTLVYSNYEGTVTVYCSDYPGFTDISLTVNGVTDTINCDSTPPTIGISYSPTTWTNGNVIVTATCSDSGGCPQTTKTVTATTNGNGSITMSDNAGNSATAPYSVTWIDKVVPTVSFSCTNSSISATAVSCSASRGNPGPSPDYLQIAGTTKDGYVGGGVTTTSTTASATYSANGTYSIYARAYDAAGNSSQSSTVSFKIDTSNPTMSANQNLGTWYNAATLPSFSFVARDQRSTTVNQETGLASMSATLNGSAVSVSGFSPTNDISPVTVTVSNSTLLSNSAFKQGSNTLRFTVKDKVNNTATLDFVILYDNTDPTISFSDKNSAWRNDAIGTGSKPISVSAADQPGLSGIWSSGVQYKVLQGASVPSFDNACSGGTSAVPTISQDGIYNVAACVRDNATNFAKASQTYKVDRTPPTLTATNVTNTWVKGGTTTITAADPTVNGVTSGLTYAKYIWDNATGCVTSGTSYTNVSFTLAEGIHTLYQCAADGAGNVSSNASTYYVDLHDPVTDLNALRSSYKANEITFTAPIRDDLDKTDTTAVYGGNYRVHVKLLVTGPNSYSNEMNVFNNSTYSTTIPFTAKGDYNVTILLTDKSGRTFTASKAVHVYPSDPVASGSALSLSSSTPAGSKFADDSESYAYSFVLKDRYGNTIYDPTKPGDRKPSLVEQKALTPSTPGFRTVQTDMRNANSPTGWAALVIPSGYAATPTDANGTVAFAVRSVAPGVFTQSFHVTIPNWNDDYVQVAGNTVVALEVTGPNSFKKPITAQLEVADGEFSIGTVEDISLVGTQAKAGFVPDAGSSVYLRDMNLLTVTDTANYSVRKSNLVEADKKSTIDLLLNITGKKTPVNVIFPTSSLGYVTYKLGGKTVYYLATDSAVNFYPADSISAGISAEATFLGLNIVGQYQGQGKQTVANDLAKNFSDVSKSAQRDMIRKNAFKLIAQRQPDTAKVIETVKYVKGTHKISQLGTGFGTLILLDGNLILDSKNVKVPGIIVLRTDQSRENVGNVYVTPGVATIHGSIYADGSLISADTSGTPYLTDSTARTAALKYQLYMKGSLFTRNTIGGALAAGGDFILPGGKTTTDFGKAMVYDLNYVRRGSTGWNSNTWTRLYNGGRFAAFEIEYDPTLLTNPPKGFEAAK